MTPNNPGDSGAPKVTPALVWLDLDAEQQAELADNDRAVLQWLADLRGLAAWVPTGRTQ